MSDVLVEILIFGDVDAWFGECRVPKTSRASDLDAIADELLLEVAIAFGAALRTV